MTFKNEWVAIGARIKALALATHHYVQFRGAGSEPYGAAKELGHQANDTYQSILRFRENNKTALPIPVAEALDKFSSGQPGQVLTATPELKQALAAITYLSTLEAELSYLLSDSEELLRTRTELAFAHLNRTLVVDKFARENWTNAFDDSGEVRCEALGAVHLLLHGVWAFKVDAKGARTDLIYNDPSPEVDGLVLTEWKVADETNAAKRFEEARKQADLYAVGPLGGIELRTTRYLVVVTKKALSGGLVPIDHRDSGVTYRHINVVIAADTPSVSSKK